MQYEKYTLILKHEYDTGEDEFELEEPLVLQMCYCRDANMIPAPVTINRLFDIMRQEALQRYSETEGRK